MREALAAQDDRDFVLSGPRVMARPGSEPRMGDPRASRGAPGARPPTRGAVGLGATLARGIRLVRRRFGLLAGIAVFTAGGAAVLVNALGLQSGRHPAPIFAAAEPVRPVARPVRPEPPRAPEVVRAAPVTTAAAPVEAAGPRPPARPAAEVAAPRETGTIRPAAAAAPARPRDAIGEMIRATDPAAPAARADRSIAFAQRALAKLRYGELKADGVMGAGTRGAIERFERDQKLPVTGEAAGRTLRELAARSGLAVEQL